MWTFSLKFSKFIYKGAKFLLKTNKLNLFLCQKDKIIFDQGRPKFSGWHKVFPNWPKFFYEVISFNFVQWILEKYFKNTLVLQKQAYFTTGRVMNFQRAVAPPLSDTETNKQLINTVNFRNYTDFSFWNSSWIKDVFNGSNREARKIPSNEITAIIIRFQRANPDRRIFFLPIEWYDFLPIQIFLLQCFPVFSLYLAVNSSFRYVENISNECVRSKKWLQMVS